MRKYSIFVGFVLHPYKVRHLRGLVDVDNL